MEPWISFLKARPKEQATKKDKEEKGTKEAEDAQNSKKDKESRGQKRKAENSKQSSKKDDVKKAKSEKTPLAIKDQQDNKGEEAASEAKSKKKKKESETEKTEKKTKQAKKGIKGSKQKKKLARAESKMTKINSSTHHTEYLRYKRWIGNKKRFPQALVGRIETEDGRANLFKDYIEAGGKVEEILLRHEQALIEQQKSKIRYGFRSEQWIKKTHGEEKAERVMKRKLEQGLCLVFNVATTLEFVLVS